MATASTLTASPSVTAGSAIASASLKLQPHQIEDADTRRLALEVGMARDAVYDALQAYADAVYRELVEGLHHARGMRFTDADADLIARGMLDEIGTEMAHDWAYGPTAP
jgi:hypothetical protein